jgi:4-hydroxythreonine-4-phosphate dehydrogenase
MENKVRLVVTPGDPDGVGPEILARLVREKRIPQTVELTVVGSEEALRRHGLRDLAVIAAPAQAPAKRHLGGYQSGWSIETATQLVLKGQADALVTGPIHKEHLQKGGYRFPGHTEFLAKLCKAKSVTMMLANEDLRVTLVTIHVALKDVSKAITRKSVRQAILHTESALRLWWGKSQPRIAVSALNPHGGESGLFGKEESKVIEPELKALRKRFGSSVVLEGPVPADTLFAVNHQKPRSERFDAVVCMYHDQALIPVKLIDFPHTVNITLGLPIIRTSVDHGTGFDIVGKGLADPSSFEAAIQLAADLVRSRRQ